MTSGISVGAILEVSHDGKVDTLTPRLVSNPNAGQGGPNMLSEPAKLTGSQTYDIHIEQVFAGEGAVALSIPGLVENSAPDRVILDISRKPAINLLCSARH